MRRVNAMIANSSFWILLLHLSPSSCASRVALDERIKRPRTDGGA
jgi:hypothetical protein